MIERIKRAAGHAWSLVYNGIADFFGDQGTQLAASISYFALLSLFPTAIVVTAAFGIIVSDGGARQEVIDAVLDALPLREGEGRTDLANLLSGVTDSAGAVGAAGLVGLLITASALMGAVRNSLGTVWSVEERRPPLQGKAIDILLVFGLGLLIGLSLAASIVQQFAIDLSTELGFAGTVLDAAIRNSSVLIPTALAAIAFTFLFTVISAGGRHKIRDVWPGVVFATVGYELVKRGFTLYLDNFANYAAIYGSLGAIVAFMVFVYVAAMSFLIGAEIAALWPRVRAGELDEEEAEPLGEQIKGFLRGLVVRR